MDGTRDDNTAAACSRADLDIALARLALRLERAASYVMHGMSEHDRSARHAALADWFSTISDGIVRSVEPRHRRYAQDRVDAIAAACPALANPSGGSRGRRSGRRTSHSGGTQGLRGA